MNANVLIVDDSKLDIFFIKRLLEYLGVNSDEANGGRECLKLVRNNTYEIILMDFMMPSMSGVETMKQIRSGIDNRNESTPVIALVSPDDPSEGRICLEAGFNNYLEKPVDFKQLIALLIMYLPDAVRRELRLPSPDIKKNNKEKDLNVESTSFDESSDGDVNITSLLNNVEGIDAEQGIKLCGSEEGYLTALNIFYQSIDVKAEEIEKYYRENDFENYTIKVHALKSSGNLIGAERLRAEAKAMEDAGNNGDIEKIEDNTENLLAYYRSFKEKLKFLKKEEEKKPPIDESALQDAYNALGEFSDSMDFDLAAMVVESMKEFELPEDDAEKFRMIEDKLSNLDWDAIKEIIEK